MGYSKRYFVYFVPCSLFNCLKGKNNIAPSAQEPRGTIVATFSRDNANKLLSRLMLRILTQGIPSANASGNPGL